MTVTKKAYAKINLHLDVTGIMDGGFHSVNNVMQSVSLCDTVTLTSRDDNQCHVSCNLKDVPTGTDNIATRAFLAFCEYIGKPLGADILIEKNIPMAAGLAGGSADAAATLLAANDLFGSKLSIEELCDIGSRLGSDVPFCIVGGSAIAHGKGDKLFAFPSLPDCTVVISKGGEGVSTPEAYRMLDTVYDRFCNYIPRSTDDLKNALQSGDIDTVCKNLFNIFEEPILSCRPVAAHIKTIMLDSDADAAMMSGSGPSVFGIFKDAQNALSAAKSIEKAGYEAHICRPM